MGALWGDTSNIRWGLPPTRPPDSTAQTVVQPPLPSQLSLQTITRPSARPPPRAQTPVASVGRGQHDADSCAAAPPIPAVPPNGHQPRPRRQPPAKVQQPRGGDWSSVGDNDTTANWRKNARYNCRMQVHFEDRELTVHQPGGITHLPWSER